jgi:hypothetical protein
MEIIVFGGDAMLLTFRGNLMHRPSGHSSVGLNANTSHFILQRELLSLKVRLINLNF